MKVNEKYFYLLIVALLINNCVVDGGNECIFGKPLTIADQSNSFTDIILTEESLDKARSAVFFDLCELLFFFEINL